MNQQHLFAVHLVDIWFSTQDALNFQSHTVLALHFLVASGYVPSILPVRFAFGVGASTNRVTNTAAHPFLAEMFGARAAQLYVDTVDTKHLLHFRCFLLAFSPPKDSNFLSFRPTVIYSNITLKTTSVNFGDPSFCGSLFCTMYLGFCCAQKRLPSERLR